MRKSKQIGTIHVTFELLEDLLKLDSKHHIVDVFRTKRDNFKEQLTVKIRGPKMPTVLEGTEMPYMPIEDLPK